nr:AP-4 complex subunit epsilon-1 [Polyrhizophydium stewartii]
MSAKRAKALRAGLDPDFHELLVQLSKTASATTQRNLLAAEVQSLRLLAAAPPSKSKASKSRLLVRAMFCEMMGFDTSDFAYLQAVTLCQDSRNLFEKRLAHLVAAIFMQSGHELSLMMTNTLQRVMHASYKHHQRSSAVSNEANEQDLCSSNVFEVAMALGVVAATATTDMIPSLVRFVEQCLKHDK